MEVKYSADALSLSKSRRRSLLLVVATLGHN
jgi:hypothetical protein